MLGATKARSSTRRTVLRLADAAGAADGSRRPELQVETGFSLRRRRRWTSPRRTSTISSRDSAPRTPSSSRRFWTRTTRMLLFEGFSYRGQSPSNPPARRRGLAAWLAGPRRLAFGLTSRPAAAAAARPAAQPARKRAVAVAELERGSLATAGTLAPPERGAAGRQWRPWRRATRAARGPDGAELAESRGMPVPAVEPDLPERRSNGCAASACSNLCFGAAVGTLQWTHEAVAKACRFNHHTLLAYPTHEWRRRVSAVAGYRVASRTPSDSAPPLPLTRCSPPPAALPAGRFASAAAGCAPDDDVVTITSTLLTVKAGDLLPAVAEHNALPSRHCTFRSRVENGR